MTRKTPQEIISDEEIEEVHANANFGSISKRDVVNSGVLKYSMGYSSGHTMFCILLEHGLIKKPKNSMTQNTELTKKGRQYFAAVYGGYTKEIFNLVRES